MSLFTILPISVDDATLPVIPAGDIEFFGEGELSAYAHWLLGGSQTSLADIVNDRTLSLQSASYPPTYSQNYITHSLTTGRGLLSGLTEPATSGGYTLCRVQRIFAGVGTPCITSGTLGQTPNPVTGGSTWFFPEEGGGATRPVGLTYRGPFSSLDTGMDITLGDWFFVATSFSYANWNSAQIKVLKGQAGSAATFQAGPSATAYTPSASPIALGNAYYPGSTAGNIDTAEFLLFDSALTLAELSAIYERSKVRMARRGIAI